MFEYGGLRAQQGHYDLHSPGNRIITPSSWEGAIVPGMKITMTLWYTKDPVPKPET